MPSRRAHRYLTLLYFGSEYNKLHEALDRPARWMGPAHRRMFHDYEMAAYIARLLYPNDRAAISAAFFHLELDRMCSADPIYASSVELRARLYGRRRRRSRRGLFGR